jgi:hypothetical protein
VTATSALLIIVAPALVARQAPYSAAWMLLAALLPWWPRWRTAAIVVAYAGAAACLVNAFRVPLGARAGVYVIAAVAFALRVWSLRTDAARAFWT